MIWLLVTTGLFVTTGGVPTTGDVNCGYDETCGGYVVWAPWDGNDGSGGAM
ncbi:MAG: hypothetical protein KDA90_19605 [Planctomycetaceae bacterium]|nr:hypothetical protein [Planctomycetaceae bacterium]